MPKKLKLTDIKVQSFVTDWSKQEERKPKNGVTGSGCCVEDSPNMYA
jgi:hypothetical protein